MNSITFAMYEIYARHVGAEIIRTQSREHDLEEFYQLYLEHKPEMIFICTPNNPTGDAIETLALKSFLKKIDNQAGNAVGDVIDVCVDPDDLHVLPRFRSR